MAKKELKMHAVVAPTDHIRRGTGQISGDWAKGIGRV